MGERLYTAEQEVYEPDLIDTGEPNYAEGTSDFAAAREAVLDRFDDTPMAYTVNGVTYRASGARQALMLCPHLQDESISADYLAYKFEEAAALAQQTPEDEQENPDELLNEEVPANSAVVQPAVEEQAQRPVARTVEHAQPVIAVSADLEPAANAWQAVTSDGHDAAPAGITQEGEAEYEKASVVPPAVPAEEAAALHTETRMDETDSAGVVVSSTARAGVVKSATIVSVTEIKHAETKEEAELPLIIEQKNDSVPHVAIEDIPSAEHGVAEMTMDRESVPAATESVVGIATLVTPAFDEAPMVAKPDSHMDEQPDETPHETEHNVVPADEHAAGQATEMAPIITSEPSEDETDEEYRTETEARGDDSTYALEDTGLHAERDDGTDLPPTEVSLLERAVVTEQQIDSDDTQSEVAVPQEVAVIAADMIGEMPTYVSETTATQLYRQADVVVGRIEVLEKARSAEECHEALEEIRSELATLLSQLGYADAARMAEGLTKQYDMATLKKYVATLMRTVLLARTRDEQARAAKSVPSMPYHLYGEHAVRMVVNFVRHYANAAA